MIDFCTLLGIENNPSVVYHPQMDGQTEWINQELEQYLRLFVNHHQDDCIDWLSIAEFSYNNRVHVSTGHSPFYLMHGYHPATGMTPSVTVHTETTQEFIDCMTHICTKASAALQCASDAMKRYYNAHRLEAVLYHPGDLVWLKATNIPSRCPMKKLDD